MKSDPIIKQEVRKKLPSNSKLKVGICWRSGMLSPTRNMNYTLLDDWAFMGDRDLKSQIDFVNLQYGDCEREILEAENKFAVNILRWPGIDLKTEIDFNFALVDCLDAVISVNSSPSVYSGALGVQTIYLTKADWTFLGQTMFPWFSSFKVISPREFDPVSATLCELPSLLNEMLSNRSLKP